MSPLASPPPGAAPDLPIDAETLYPEGDGFLARRAKAGRARLLGRLAPVLRRALAPGETIRYAARATRHHLGEYFFAGAAAQYHNRVALVVTDRRLLLVQLDRRGRPWDTKHAVALESIRGTRRGPFAWKVRLADGTALAFASVRAADRLRLEGHLPPAGGPAADEPSLAHLCPACVRNVPGGPGTTAACPHPDCRVPFRDPLRAARLSALLPGLGDLYLRRHLFGALELLASMLALGVALAFLVRAATERDAPALAAAGLVLLLAVLLPRLVDHRLTLHVGRKGLVPLALAPAPGGQARNLPSFPRWTPLLVAAGAALAAAIPLALADGFRHDVEARRATRLAAEGRFDEAMAGFEALSAEGGATDERRLRFGLALVEAGDVEDAERVGAAYGGAPALEPLARRWNAAVAAHAAADADYRAGLLALALGDGEAAWPAIDRALRVFRDVKRPHLPASRPEVEAHLAVDLLAPPLDADALADAAPHVAAAAGAPEVEAAIVRAAYDSARGRRAAARAALSGVDLALAPPRFRLLALEARARLAEGEAEREAIRSAARAIPGAGLQEGDARRVGALLAADPPGRAGR